MKLATRTSATNRPSRRRTSHLLKAAQARNFQLYRVCGSIGNLAHILAELDQAGAPDSLQDLLIDSLNSLSSLESALAQYNRHMTSNANGDNLSLDGQLHLLTGPSHHSHTFLIDDTATQWSN